MKIIQSLWTLPSQGQETVEGRAKGGWLAPEFHYMSMALSCSLLRRHYKEVELITDEQGKELLIDRFKLPYTSVKVCLDRFNHYHRGLWALPKLFSYSIQDRPFLHVDGDVFTWSPLDASGIVNHPLIAQSPELQHEEIYLKSLQHIQSQLHNLPLCMQPSYANGKPIISVNAGVLGGSDLEFLHNYATTALDFLASNESILCQDANAGLVNIAAEQYLFSEMAKEAAKEVYFVIPQLSADFREVVQLNKVPAMKSFIHLIGHAKKEFYSCEQVQHRLRYEFPNQYDLIQRALASSVPLQYYIPVGTRDLPYFAVPSNLKVSGTSTLQTKSEQPKQPVAQDLGSLRNELLAIWTELETIANELAQINPFGFAAASKIYDFMSDAKVNAIMSTKFTLSESSHIISYVPRLAVSATTPNGQNDDSGDEQDQGFVILQHRDPGVFGQKLTGWSELLVYFQGESLTGEELIKLISEDVEDTKLGFIREAVYEFVCSHLIYTGYLTLATIPQQSNS
ncbi:hypothetical protein GCM10027594_16080 [Hymenobacter agri]